MSIILFASGAAARAADVSATLSSDSAYVGVPIFLQLNLKNISSHEKPTVPNIPGLNIQSTGAPSQSLRVMNINGRVTRNESLTYTWSVTPVLPGRYTIPALTLKVNGQNVNTRPMNFTAVKSDVGDLLFVDVVGQKKSVYVGQALPLTLQIFLKPYHDKDLQIRLEQQNMWKLVSPNRSQWGQFKETIEKMAREGEWPQCQSVLRKDEKGREEIYYRYDIPAVITPQKPGRLSMENLFILVDWPTRLAVQRDFFGRAGLRLAGTRPLAKSATVQPINVKPIPTKDRPAWFRGAVGNGYAIAAQAQPTTVKAGDPIEVVLVMTGPGRLDHLQAPPIAKMPELTRRFKTPEEDLPGIVHNNRKYFRINLRPRNTDVKEIPPIPLVYFDPDADAFKTIETQAIPITVLPAEKLADSAIVSASPGGEAEQSSDSDTPKVVSPAWYKDAHKLLRGSAIPPMWLYLLLLAGGPGVFLLTAIGKIIHRSMSNTTAQRIRSAKNRAIKKLRNADAADEIALALIGYLADKLNAPPGLTGHEAADRLAQANVEQDLINDVRGLIEIGQHAQYAGMNSAATAELRDRARRIIDQLDNLKPFRSKGGAV